MKRTVNLREMSATTPNPQIPSVQGQESQTRKIMMDLQQEKKRLRLQQQQGSINWNIQSQIQGGGMSPKLPPTTPLIGNQVHPFDASPQSTVNQRNALQVAQSTTFGCFVMQSSAYGNIILPVIPRVGPNTE